MITNYNQFLELIFEAEAYSEKQSKQKAEEFITSIYKNKAVAAKKASIKKREINREDLSITNEEWKQITQEISRLKAEKKQEELDSITDEKFLRVMEISNLINTEGKLTEEELKDVEEKSKNDPFYLRLQKITEDNPEMIDYYIRLFYRDFKNFNIDLEKDEIYEQVIKSLGKFSYDPERKIKILWNNENNYGTFGEANDSFKRLEKEFKSKILDNFQKYKQEVEIQLQSGDLIDPGVELFSNDVRDVKVNTYADLLLSTLPRGLNSVAGVNKAINYFLYIYNETPDGDTVSISPNVLNMYKEWVNLNKPKKIDVKNPKDEEIFKKIYDVYKNEEESKTTFETKNINNKSIYLKPSENREWFAPDLLKEFENQKEDDSKFGKIKKQIKISAKKLVEKLLERGISFKIENIEQIDRTGKKTFRRILPEIESKIKLSEGSISDPQSLKNFEDILKKINELVENYSNVDVKRVFDSIKKVNKILGENSDGLNPKDDIKKGAKLIFDSKEEKPVIVFEVKTPKANYLLHNKYVEFEKVVDTKTGETKNEPTSGILTRTPHCIAWPLTPNSVTSNTNRWKTYMTAEGDRLYYVYNFKLKETDPKFPFGIIVDIEGKIKDAHDNLDADFTNKALDIIESYGLDYDAIFSGLSEEEREKINKKKNAEQKIKDPYITVEEFAKCLENGADPNTMARGGDILKNSVMQVSLEKVNLLAEKNVNFNDPADILLKAIDEYFRNKNTTLDLIINKLLEIRIGEAAGVNKNLGHNPIYTIKEYLNAGSYERLRYLLSKNINFKIYDPKSQCLEYVQTIDDILLLLNYGLRINREVNEDPVYKVMFPKKIVDAAFILTSREILNKIPAKKDLSPRDVSCHEIFSHALIWSVETNNFDYFKMVLDISKQRLDAGENDFIVTFLNTDLDIPERFENYLEIKTDEIYEE